MEKKTLNSRVAAQVGVDARTSTQLTDALAGVIGDILTDRDSVAIPGFGEFSPIKTDEHISLDSDGRRLLMPPAITIKFTPGTALRNKLS